MPLNTNFDSVIQAYTESPAEYARRQKLTAEYCRQPANEAAEAAEIRQSPVQAVKGRMSMFPNSTTGCYEFVEAPHRGRDD